MTAPAKAHGSVRRTTSTASTAATGAQEPTHKHAFPGRFALPRQPWKLDGPPPGRNPDRGPRTPGPLPG